MLGFRPSQLPPFIVYRAGRVRLRGAMVYMGARPMDELPPRHAMTQRRGGGLSSGGRFGLPRPRSRAVLELWQDLHSGRRFAGSSRAPPSLMGAMWSSSVASVMRPCSLQNRHAGSARRTRSRTRRHARSYPRRAALGRLSVAGRVCVGQRPDVTSSGQPGCVHGRGARRGLTSPRGSAVATPPPRRQRGPRRTSTLGPCRPSTGHTFAASDRWCECKGGRSII